MEQKSKEFWWGSGDKNGINWVSWDNMKKSKNLGGIGFRDMEAFNKAMLAKESWRLLTKPNSLVSRIMKAKYHLEGEMINAKLGRSPSYAWRSLVAGIDVLRNGLVRKLGNGGATNLFMDPWLDRPGSLRVYFRRPPLEDKLGRDYVIDSSWDVRKLNLVLWPVDIADILRMQVPHVHSTTEDTWRWNYEDPGCYSVKSGYSVIMKEMDDQGEVARPSRHQNFGWTKALWKLKIQKKIVFFVLRVARNILPTRKTLHRRHIIEDEACLFCGEVESNFHALVLCSVAAELWNSFLKLPFIGVSSIEAATGDLIPLLFDKLSSMDRARLAVGLWSLWLNRNNKMLNKTSQPLHGILDRAELALTQQPLLDYIGERSTTVAQNVTATDFDLQQMDSSTRVLQFDGHGGIPTI